jgi:hypothetical protein
MMLPRKIMATVIATARVDFSRMFSPKWPSHVMTLQNQKPRLKAIR